MPETNLSPIPLETRMTVPAVSLPQTPTPGPPRRGPGPFCTPRTALSGKSTSGPRGSDTHYHTEPRRREESGDVAPDPTSMEDALDC